MEEAVPTMAEGRTVADVPMAAEGVARTVAAEDFTLAARILVAKVLRAGGPARHGKAAAPTGDRVDLARARTTIVLISEVAARPGVAREILANRSGESQAARWREELEQRRVILGGTLAQTGLRVLNRDRGAGMARVDPLGQGRRDRHPHLIRIGRREQGRGRGVGVGSADPPRLLGEIRRERPSRLARIGLPSRQNVRGAGGTGMNHRATARHA